MMNENEVKKFYYVRECDPETFDYRDYLDEDELIYSEVAICGNREFCDVNGNLINTIVKNLQDCKYDLDVVRTDFMDEEGNFEDEETYLKEMFSTIGNYFKIDLMDEAKVMKMIELCDNFEKGCGSTKDKYIILEALSIVSGKKYYSREIHGSCQGDWNVIFYPEETSEDYIKYLEAIYFATGTELEISCEPCTKEDFENDEVEVYHDYTYLYNPTAIKEKVAADNSVDVTDVKLLRIANTYTVRKFDYEEV